MIVPAITLAVYCVGLIGIGLWASRKAKGQDAFLLGDRSLGPWTAGLAYAASSSSAWVLLGYSGFVYAVGPSALWMVPGILAGYAAIWLWAGPVLQEASREKGHLTLTDFLAEFASPGTGRIIRVLASLVIAFCFAFFVASQFQGAGTALDGLFNTGFVPGVVIGAAVIIAYVFLGGFLAVSVTDMIQGLLMAFVAVLLPVVTFLAAGGLSGIGEMFEASGPAYSATFGNRAGMVAGGFVLGLTATGFGAMGQPHLVSWIMAARDKSARVRGAAIAIGWGLLVYAGMAVLGLSARAALGGDLPGETVFFEAARQFLPGALAGVIVAATLSAIMSTVDSQLLVAGGAVSHDLGLGKAMGGRDVLASRLAIVAVSVVGVVLTVFLPSTIFERTLFAWIALGATFGPVVAARALGLRPSGGAVIACICVGFGLSCGYEFGLVGKGPGGVWPTTLPWVAAVVAMAFVSLVGKRT